MTWLVLVVLGLGTYRVTRLITTDTVTAPLRYALARRFPGGTRPLVRPETGKDIPETGEVHFHWVVELIYCDWCVSVWVAAVLVLAAHFTGLIGPWRWAGLAWPAVATLSGLVTNLASR